jgi:hypothetical protein
MPLAKEYEKKWESDYSLKAYSQFKHLDGDEFWDNINRVDWKHRPSRYQMKEARDESKEDFRNSVKYKWVEK